MGLAAELQSEVGTIFRSAWTSRVGTKVPEPEEVKLGNDAVELNATVLYADMSASTELVDRHKPSFAAEVYKSFLHCAARIVRSESGSITAYDGDRIMAVFIGEAKNTSAVRAALKINWARVHIVNPLLNKQYPDISYQVKHTVGVDTSDLWVARTGIRGSNDLVWVGRAANHAAKLCTLDDAYPTWISADVHNNMHASVKTAGDGRNMWEARSWTSMGGRSIFRSSFWWRID